MNGSSKATLSPIVKETQKSTFTTDDKVTTTTKEQEANTTQFSTSFETSFFTESPKTTSSKSATTQVSSLPQECLTATNFTQHWRTDHEGRDLRGGGPHSVSGYACDLHKGLGWFRFTGLAGKFITYIDTISI